MCHRISALPRRAILCWVVAAGLAAFGGPPAFAQAPAEAAQPVQALEAALIGVMKAGRGTSFDQRYQMLAPVVQRTFDMPAVLRAAVGLGWAKIPAGQQALLLQAFIQYSTANWVSNFDSYSGQSFRLLPGRALGGGYVVATELVPASGAPHRFDFVMRQTGSGWRAVDVLQDGTISQVAVLRSDFEQLLSQDPTGAQLTESLKQKAANMAMASAPV
ncbi:MAG TPA: ABC transporter substrate-binding protein [Acetobacteraceae bacterium]|nr:ABC transporter substrate-binding protein [Acetobacteraceae bacterium]